MKYILLLFLAFNLTACATTGAFLQSFGQGLNQNARKQKPKSYAYCVAQDQGAVVNVNCY